jgi:hypothetical protein
VGQQYLPWGAALVKQFTQGLFGRVTKPFEQGFAQIEPRVIAQFEQTMQIGAALFEGL